MLQLVVWRVEAVMDSEQYQSQEQTLQQRPTCSWRPGSICPGVLAALLLSYMEVVLQGCARRHVQSASVVVEVEVKASALSVVVLLAR